MISETALEWFDRCQKHGNSGSRKRRRREDSICPNRNEEESIEPPGADDPSTAAWRFLRFGKSGIAPIDEAWGRSGVGGRSKSTRGQFLPPVTIVEGPKDVGKTWMLLTLAARFVVATRASRFTNDCSISDKESKRQRRSGDNAGLDIDTDDASSRKEDNKDRSRPKVLLLDSTYDFSVPQLVNVVHSTLVRERQKEKQFALGRNNQRGPQAQGGKESHTNDEISDLEEGSRANNHHDSRREPRHTIEEELERQEQETISLEEDIEDCLSRIHIIQVDNGPTGWVSMLEAISYQLSDDPSHNNNEWNIKNDRNYSRGSETSPTGSPTLLLWDGFLSDMSLPTNAIMAQKASVVLGESYGSYNNTQILFESPSTQEVLMQLSRLMQKHSNSLWLVVTTRTVPVATSATTNEAKTEQSGIGSRLTEWIRKEEGKRRREQDGAAKERREASVRYHAHQQQELKQQQQRASYRIRLDRRYDGRAMGDGHIPSTTAAAAALFAKVVGGGEGNPPAAESSMKNAVNNRAIPYSISIGGILS